MKERKKDQQTKPFILFCSKIIVKCVQVLIQLYSKCKLELDLKQDELEGSQKCLSVILAFLLH